jgi:methionine-gamma-lyase
VHSLTKFVSGASDIIGGVICGSTEFIMSLMNVNTGALMLLGPTMDPRIAFQLSLRLPHLGLRIKEHSRRALELAGRLRKLGVDVTYPGLPDHPQHKLLRTLVNEEYGFGGIFTIDAKTTEQADALMESLQNDEAFGYMAVSLGYFDTLMSESAVSTSSEMGEEALASAGVRKGLIRFSIGITGTLEQRWEQLERSLRKVGLVGQPAA